MNRLNFLRRMLASITVVLVLLTASFLVGQETAAAKIDFVKDIRPIIEQHCLKCHGPVKEENFRIDQRGSAMDYIIPGESKSSDIYTLLVSDDPEKQMPPPEEAERLDDSDIRLIKDWIDQGADWPDDVKFESPSREGVSQDGSTVGTTSEEKKNGTAEKSEATTPLVGQENPSNGTAKPAAPQPEYSIWNAIGSLHPAILHLPIGLLIAAGFFALVGFRGNFVMSDCAYYCLWLGTFGAILACVTGWWFSPLEGKGTVATFQDLWDQSHPVFWHRSSALVATLFAFLLCLFAKSARSRDPDDGFLWKLGAVVLALGIAFVGHKGGTLTHGKNLYRDLFGLIEQQTGWDLDGSDANPPAKEKPADSKNENNDPPIESKLEATKLEATKSDENRAPASAGKIE
jgi:hypothetical protein